MTAATVSLVVSLLLAPAIEPTSKEGNSHGVSALELSSAPMTCAKKRWSTEYYVEFPPKLILLPDGQVLACFVNEGRHELIVKRLDDSKADHEIHVLLQKMGTIDASERAAIDDTSLYVIESNWRLELVYLQDNALGYLLSGIKVVGQERLPRFVYGLIDLDDETIKYVKPFVLPFADLPSATERGRRRPRRWQYCFIDNAESRGADGFLIAAIYRAGYLHPASFLSGEMMTYDNAVLYSVRADEAPRVQPLSRVAELTQRAITITRDSRGRQVLVWIEDERGYPGKLLRNRYSDHLCIRTGTSEGVFSEVERVLSVRGSRESYSGLVDVGTAATSDKSGIVYTLSNGAIHWVERQTGSGSWGSSSLLFDGNRTARSIVSVRLSGGVLYVLFSEGPALSLLRRGLDGNVAILPVTRDRCLSDIGDMVIGQSGMVHVAYLCLVEDQRIGCFYRRFDE